MAKRSPQHFFSKLASVNIGRSSFDRSHTHKTTFSSDYLIPIFYDQVLPGDTFNLSHSIYLRLISPLDVPMMDNLYLDTFYFFVPDRLIWTNFKAFMGEKRRPSDKTDYTTPKINISSKFAINTIYDYFGLPYGVTGYTVLAAPFRSYNLIINEWFRDENLIEYLPENVDDGPDDMKDYVLFKRGKRFDYFTSCLPEPQEGEPVSIPLGTTAPVSVYGTGMALGVTDGTNSGAFKTISSGLAVRTDCYGVNVGSNPSGSAHLDVGAFGVTGDASKSGLAGTADLSSAVASTVSILRQSFQMQAFQEIDARGGTRYTELLYSHFGVISPDARLQRPEYLGGSHDRIMMSPVVQQSSGDVGKLGDLAAYMYGSSNTHGFTRSFTEHGHIIGLACVYSDLTYQQGLNRQLSRSTKFDYYWPEFANLTDQAVLNKEIYTQGNAEDDKVFGYAERYAEYKYFPNMITGELRSTYEQTLDIWHLAQKFDNLPTLSEEFITSDTPIERIVSVTDEVQFVADMLFRCNCVRPMPLYNDPMKWFMRG